MAVNRTKTDQYQLRLPPGLRDQLREAAEKNNRSMNAEIVGRLEAYDMLQWRIGELLEERERLAVQLEAAKAALIEQKTIAAQLQHLINENYNEAKREEETTNVIETKYNELKAQSDYLESLKAELLELSKEREGINDDLVKHQKEAMEMLVESHRTATTVLRDIAKRQDDPETTGTPLTPELFDKLFNQLVRVEQKLNEGSKK
ncbi:Arc family DNA-binding protein [Sinorhizobium medicae]|nr:Arc family DNA-binding protein [Sinorhizobium medicae]MDX0651715.1 Arc family DNA-binding protein [Sinorhizobium medicae]MDX0700879.1 Arc family DNA-binding protein [Sinorhizobium medicae]